MGWRRSVHNVVRVDKNLPVGWSVYKCKEWLSTVIIKAMWVDKNLHVGWWSVSLERMVDSLLWVDKNLPVGWVVYKSKVWLRGII